MVTAPLSGSGQGQRPAPAPLPLAPIFPHLSSCFFGGFPQPQAHPHVGPASAHPHFPPPRPAAPRPSLYVASPAALPPHGFPSL